MKKLTYFLLAMVILVMSINMFSTRVLSRLSTPKTTRSISKIIKMDNNNKPENKNESFWVRFWREVSKPALLDYPVVNRWTLPRTVYEGERTPFDILSMAGRSSTIYGATGAALGGGFGFFGSALYLSMSGFQGSAIPVIVCGAMGVAYGGMAGVSAPVTIPIVMSPFVIPKLLREPSLEKQD